MVINLVTLWALEIPLAYGLSRWAGLGATGVWWGRALANVANGLLFASWFRRGKWKKKEI
jgi:Na+-driven multidrug efflux pump